MEEATLSRNVNRFWAAPVISVLLTVSPAHAQKAYGPGASDTEIKLGQSTPLWGPASAFGIGTGRTVVGYFNQRAAALTLSIHGPCGQSRRHVRNGRCRACRTSWCTRSKQRM